MATSPDPKGGKKGTAASQGQLAEPIPDPEPTAMSDRPSVLGRLVMETTLPRSQKVLRMCELTGEQEIACAMQSGGGEDNPRSRTILVWSQTMRSCVSIDGAPFDASEHTPESFRQLFNAIDYTLVWDLYLQCNRPTEEQAEAVKKSTRVIA